MTFVRFETKRTIMIIDHQLNVAGTSPYQLEYNVSYAGNAIDIQTEPTAEACATACSLWRRDGSSCAVWTWSPDSSNKANGFCTLASMVGHQTKGTTGSITGVLGELRIALSSKFRTTLLLNCTSIKGWSGIQYHPPYCLSGWGQMGGCCKWSTA